MGAGRAVLTARAVARNAEEQPGNASRTYRALTPQHNTSPAPAAFDPETLKRCGRYYEQLPL
jgi:hypothetical protein